MSFLHFGLLALLPLASIPILLHLLTLHRLKTVELSTYRFLFDSYIQQRRRMQFLEALLAMLRTLFLALLVFMLAGPVFNAGSGLFSAGRGAAHVVLLVDCSASMNARTGGLSALDRAKDAALLVAKSLREEDSLTLVQVAARPKQLYSGFLAGEHSDPAERTTRKTPGEVVDLLQVTSSRGDIFAALSDVFGPDAAKRPNASVFLVTDCQSSGWREVRDRGLEGLIPAHTPLAVIDVGAADDLANRAVVGDAPRGDRAVAGLPHFFQARVVNASKAEKAELTLSLVIDDKEAARAALSLKPGETVVHRFPYTPREPGVLRGRFEIAGAPDRFPDDDRYLFALNVTPRVKAVIVDGQPPGQPPQDADEAHFLKTALTSGVHAPSEEGKPPPEGKAPADAADDFLRPFDVKVVPEAALTPPAPGQPPEALRDADLVVLANCGGLQAPQFEALREFATGGGGLLIFPGDRVNPQLYNDQFFPVPGPQGERLTAATLGPPEGDPDKVETFEQLGKIDQGHPALALFDNPDATTRPLSSFRIYKRFKIVLPEKKGNAWPLAWFSGGSPALVESRLGDGDVVLSAFPAHTRWTGLPTRPDFAPLVMQLADHAARRPAVDAPAVVLADGTAELAVDAAWGDVKAQIKTPSGRVVDQAFERKGPRLRAAFTDTSERGYYTLDVRSTSPKQGAAGQRVFAVNLSPEESEFVMLNADEVRALLPSADVQLFDFPKDGPKLQERLVGRGWVFDRTMWLPLLLLVLVSEFLMATWGGRRKKGEEESPGAERVNQARAGAWAGGMAGAPSK